MRKLKIGFSKPKNKLFPIFSWLIRWYEKTPYSHCYLQWETSYGPKICYHAAHTSLHFLSERQFEKEITVVEEYEFTIPESRYEKVMIYCLKTCGLQYGLFEVFGIALSEKLGLKWNIFKTGDREQFCAELVYRVLGLISDDKLTTDPDMVKLSYVHGLVKEKAQK